jgi:hypothetical protein
MMRQKYNEATRRKNLLDSSLINIDGKAFFTDSQDREEAEILNEKKNLIITII